MNDQITTLLAELAQKLGTTTEYLWGFAVKNAYIDGITTTVLGTLGLLFGLTLLFFFFRENKKTVGEYDGDKATCYLLFGIVFTIISLLVVCWSGIPSFLNPEYYAFKNMVELITRN